MEQSPRKKQLIVVVAVAILLTALFTLAYFNGRHVDERAEAERHIFSAVKGSAGTVYFTDYAVGCPDRMWLIVLVDTVGDAGGVGCWTFTDKGIAWKFSHGNQGFVPSEKLDVNPDFDKAHFERAAETPLKRGYW